MFVEAVGEPTPEIVIVSPSAWPVPPSVIVTKDVDASVLIVQHISGAFVAETTGIIGVAILKENIPVTEESFWSAVDAYEYEEEQNELKRYISLIKAGYLPDVEKLFIEQLKK